LAAWHAHCYTDIMMSEADTSSVPASVWRPRRPVSFTRPPLLLLSMLSVALMLLGWWLIAVLGIVRADLLPSPTDVSAALVEILTQGYRGTTLWENIAATLGRLLGGFCAAAVVGVPLGLLMGSNRVVNAAVDWVIQSMRPLPPLSYMILLILWLGTGDLSKGTLLFLTAFPIIVSASAAGVRGVKQQRIQAAQALGATRCAVFLWVVLPSAAPMIMTGLQIALAAAFSTVVAAELLAATDGLGWMVISASSFLRNDVIVLSIILLGLLGVGLAALLRAADHLMIHWRGRE
jgi:taurine transport system permease protein